LLVPEFLIHYATEIKVTAVYFYTMEVFCSVFRLHILAKVQNVELYYVAFVGFCCVLRMMMKDNSNVSNYRLESKLSFLAKSGQGII
jgi:hypothetical protein